MVLASKYMKNCKKPEGKKSSASSVPPPLLPDTSEQMVWGKEGDPGPESAWPGLNRGPSKLSTGILGKQLWRSVSSWKIGVKTINCSVSFQDEMTSTLPSTVPGMGRCSVNMSALPPTSWFLGSWSQFDHHCQEFSSAVRLTPPLRASLSPCVRRVKWQAPLCLFYVLSHKIQLLLCPQSPRHSADGHPAEDPTSAPGKDWSTETVRWIHNLCVFIPS